MGNANELNAAYSADGYARVRGLPGVGVNSSRKLELTSSCHDVRCRGTVCDQRDCRRLCRVTPSNSHCRQHRHVSSTLTTSTW